MMQKYNLARIACVVPRVKPANMAENLDEISKALQQEKVAQCDLIIFPELAVSGYTCADLLLNQVLLQECEDQVAKFLAVNTFPGVIALGCPVRYQSLLFNAALIIQGKTILGIVPKSFLPNYKEFYEERWFESGKDFPHLTQILFAGQRVEFGCDLLFQAQENPNFIFGVEICEDLWNPQPPCVKKALGGALLIANLSASNALVGKNVYREQMIKQQSGSCLMAYAYCSAGVGESTTDTVFSGACYIMENSNVLATHPGFSREMTCIMADIDLELLLFERRQNKSFGEAIREQAETMRKVAFQVHEYPVERVLRSINKHPFVPSDPAVLTERCEEILAIQAHGLATRLEHIQCRRVVIGLSGGLDSTLALLVVLRAFKLLQLPLEGVYAVTMPGFGTTGRTLNNVLQLCQELKINVREVDIVPACLLHMKNIGHDPAIHDVTYENVQARERTEILMNLSNKLGGITIGTGDLSEIALGWSTYNGDHMSMYAVNCGVPKTLIIHLIRYVVNKEKTTKKVRDLLVDILETPISPELLPPDPEGKIQQKTEDLLGPYEVHDFYLYYLIRCAYRPSKVLFWATQIFGEEYSREQLKGWLKIFIRRFWQHQFKRSCIPDGPKVGTIALSPRGDWRMPSDASPQAWNDDLEGEE